MNSGPETIMYLCFCIHVHCSLFLYGVLVAAINGGRHKGRKCDVFQGGGIRFVQRSVPPSRSDEWGLMHSVLRAGRRSLDRLVLRVR